MIYALVLTIASGGALYGIKWMNGDFDKEPTRVEKKDESQCTAEFTSWEKYAQDVFSDFDVSVTYTQGMISVNTSVVMTDEQTDNFVKTCKSFTDKIEEYGDGADRLPALNGGMFMWKRGGISVFFSLNNTPRVTTKVLNENDFEDTQLLYEKYFEN